MSSPALASRAQFSMTLSITIMSPWHPDGAQAVAMDGDTVRSGPSAARCSNHVSPRSTPHQISRPRAAASPIGRRTLVQTSASDFRPWTDEGARAFLRPRSWICPRLRNLRASALQRCAASSAVPRAPGRFEMQREDFIALYGRLLFVLGVMVIALALMVEHGSGTPPPQTMVSTAMLAPQASASSLRQAFQDIQALAPGHP
jgi:hypothetical protein